MTTRRALLRDGGLVLLSLGLVGYGLSKRRQAGAPAPLPSSAASAQQASLPAGASAAPSEATADLGEQGCEFEDQGNFDYVRLEADLGYRVWLRPSAIAPHGDYNLLFFFHGAEPARRLLCPLGLPLIFVTRDRAGLSSAYAQTFQNALAVDTAIAAIDRVVSGQTGRPCRASKIAVGSFSAGYQAVGDYLRNSEHAPPSGVILLDSLHAGYDASRRVDPSALEPFVAAALRALDKPPYYFGLTHSAIKPPSYASTSEVADWLLDRLKVRSDRLTAPGGALRATRVARERGFSLRGFAGETREAHCAQLALLPELVRAWLNV